MRTSITPPIPLQGGTFVVVASGVAEGPSQALRRFLLERGARRVLELSHPLVPEADAEHVATDWRADGTVTRSVRRRPNRPPLTYGLDPFTPIGVPKSDAWFGFNCLATTQGLAHRALRRTTAVVHWSVDFVPNRFGPGLATRVYEAVDTLACRRADGRVDLSVAALEGRAKAYGLGSDSAPAVVIPMGAWLSESPQAAAGNLGAPRVVFLGHLVERMGVNTVLLAVAELVRQGRPIHADIIGGGPLLDDVRSVVVERGIGDHVTVHGFIAEFAQVQEILAAAAIAVAPYETDPDSFSRFADPGKLKAYLAAGLPILLTDVPPNAHELADSGGAELVESDPRSFAAAIEQLLDDPQEWNRRHQAAIDHAKAFDWSTLLDDKLTALGFDCG